MTPQWIAAIRKMHSAHVDTHLLLCHVQETDRVPVTVQVCPHRVKSLVELPLNVCQLLKNLIS